MDLSSNIDWQLFTVDSDLSGSIVVGAEPDPGVLMWSGSAWYHVSAEDYDEEDYPEPDRAPWWDAAVEKGYAFSLRNQDEDFAQWQVLTMDGVIVDLSPIRTWSRTHCPSCSTTPRSNTTAEPYSGLPSRTYDGYSPRCETFTGKRGTPGSPRSAGWSNCMISNVPRPR